MADSSGPQKNWYSILGACPTDDIQELKQKYQKLILMFHPDKQRPDVSEGEAEQHMQRFIDVDQAWKILSNEESRKEYNLQLRGKAPPSLPLGPSISVHPGSCVPLTGELWHRLWGGGHSLHSYSLT
ncbi:dnaJ homolog subfamily C member 24-like isoform X2 [Sinocyclocheilus rhinocerous]|uniref:dnaJ homolog subfamily C member 24-like isoform X2 n=1 Tax=Sinocyclocheilus rhinocerous TaxID=307959 RepID=UPI0007BAD060|nr:PREDICTED: dnaJ homolog subfamily C member 24-like isoform X2 [Sinocyclocheilus rhinocerous]